jgi:hypothetical protein
MRSAILIGLAALAGAVAAGAAMLIAVATGGTFSPVSGAVIGLAFGATLESRARPRPASRSRLDTVLCAVAAAVAAWLLVRIVQR